MVEFCIKFTVVRWIFDAKATNSAKTWPFTALYTKKPPHNRKFDAKFRKRRTSLSSRNRRLQDRRTAEQQSSRTAEQKNRRAAGQKDSRAAGQQDSRTAGQQDSRTAEP